MVTLGPPNRLRGALAFLGGIALVSAVLAVQSARHGWPFSAHHAVSRRARTGAPAATRPPSNARVAVAVDPAQLAPLGIQIVPVTRADVAGELRAVATVVPDEGRVAHIHTRVAGWIERLAVRTTGETVRPGQVLATIFSQELLASETEYLAVTRASGAGGPSALAHGARERLRVLGMTDAEIADLERRGEPTRSVPILAPRGGVVIHRGVTVGTAVDPSTELFTLADLSRVWVLAEVPEARAADVRVGTHARIDVPSSGRAGIDAVVEFVYPTLTESTRTVRVRFALDNPDGSLRPGTFGTATLQLSPRTALVVPRDAIVDTGNEQHVFVEEHPGHFVPRTVSVGARLEDRVEITGGLGEGERVVASGVFLLDSESRLRASGGAGTGHVHGGGSTSQHEAREPANEPPATEHGAHEGRAAPEPSPSTHGGHETAPPPSMPGGHTGHGG